MVVNQPTEVVFDLLPTSFVFKRGDRIRLAIAGASDGVFTVPLPASGPLVYTMHRGGSSPSRLDLPVQPSTAPAVR